MTHEVLFDFGNVKVTVLQKSYKLNGDEIREEALQTLIEQGFALPDDIPICEIVTCKKEEK